MEIEDTDTLKEARERFTLADEADSKQQAREIECIAFENGDQWPQDIKDARKAQAAIGGMPGVPARPVLVINKVKEPVRAVLNQERSSDIGIELVPADDFGDLGLTPDDTEITLREGLVRRIQRESIAADARTWAFKRAVIAGRGYYLVMTRFLPGKTWDQEVYVHRIYNQSGVLLDPSHEQPDGSDADWEFMGTWLPWDRYKREYPTLANGDANPFADASESDFMSASESYPDWYQSDGDERSVRVVDYWYTVSTSKQIAILEDGTVVDLDQVPDGVKPVDTRSIIEKSIKWMKIGGGTQELEKTDWAGPDMPIVKVLGDEVLPYDGERRADGMVGPAIDPARAENYLISKFVETVGLASIPRDTIDPDAIDGFQEWWNQANTRTLPYRPYRTFDDEGRPFRQPYASNSDTNILPIAQGIQLFDGFIQQTTGGSAPDRLGVGQRVQASSAIKRLQEEEQFNTSNFMDNLARSVRYEGRIINGLLYHIYGAKPGRMVRILSGEGETQTFAIGDPQQQQQQQQQQGKIQQVAKLTKDAHFNVVVKITKNSERRRDQFIAMFGDILAADPSQMAVGGDLFYKNMDIPEAKQLSDRQKVMLAPPVQAMIAQQESGEEPIPQAAQQQIAQMTQQLKELEQIAGQMDEALKTKQAEQQAKIQIEQTKAQSEQLRSQADMSMKKAEIDARERESALSNLIKLATVEMQTAQKDAHAHMDTIRQQIGLTHEASMASASAEQSERMADRTHQQGMESAEHMAGMQPAPEEPMA